MRGGVSLFDCGWGGEWELTLCAASSLLLSADSQLVRPADWAKHARILLVFRPALIRPAAFPGAGHNELDSKLAEHLRQTRSGRTVAMVLDTLRIVA
ncbi:MAG TPA: hypothetical protein VI685_10790 [Candidatus Angelobacter sp.]